MNEELAHDISMSFPDDIWCLNMLERYIRVRHCTEFCTLDENRFFIRGVLSVPFTEREGDFTWGVWCEVDRDAHDAFLRAYMQDTLGELPAFEAKLANDIPGYEGSGGTRLRVDVLADARPSFVSVEHEGLMAEQTAGINEERHAELHDILFGDDDEDFDDEE